MSMSLLVFPGRDAAQCVLCAKAGVEARPASLLDKPLAVSGMLGEGGRFSAIYSCFAGRGPRPSSRGAMRNSKTGATRATSWVPVHRDVIGPCDGYGVAG